ncbi:fungal-specific transcription factor domain-containing protein [Xylariales sp. PMI_506]|nr:fungal-specific transcription factor domain-containing protein [Xylariales sp. PMI_506]
MRSPDSGARPYRSRVQRPCDRCRRRKTACILLTDPPCRSCAKASRECTFDLPPVKRPRRVESLDPEPGFHQGNLGDADSLISSPQIPQLVGHLEPFQARLSAVAQSPDITRSTKPLGQSDSYGSNNIHSAPVSHEKIGSFNTDIPEVGSSLHQQDLQEQAWRSDHPQISDLNHQDPPLQAVQHVCSLDQIDGATALLCGISAELDPWLLRHCKYDSFGMGHLHGTRIRNVGGVPVNELVPVHFIVTETPEGALGMEERDLEYSIPPEQGARLISLFLKFVFPMMPIISRSQLRKLGGGNMPIVLRAAIYASALPYVVHDPVLFVSGTYNESLGEWLWKMVYELVQAGASSLQLADVQASLLCLQRLPARHRRNPSDTSWRTSFLARTVAIAISLGLHLEPSPWGIPAWEKRLRRRLWWVVYLEDKWTSLLLGRPTVIQPDEWDVLELEETDFEDTDSTAADPTTNSQCSYSSLIFLNFAKLGQLAEKLHQRFYTLRASQRLSNNFRGSIDAARPIRESLQAWYSGLPEELRFKPHSAGPFLSRRPKGTAVLHFSYLTLELLLYRAILRPLAKSPPPAPISPENASAYIDQPIPLAPFATLSPTSWFLDQVASGNLELDQLPVADSPMLAKASEATLNAAEKCASIIVAFVATLGAQDFDIMWYSWSSVCFATITNFIVLLFVQAPTVAHAARSKELLDRWSMHMQYQHKSHESLMRLGLVRLYSLQVEDLDRVFMLSSSALEVLTRGR